MGVFVYKDTINSKLPAAKLFKALVLDIDDLMVKVAPDLVKNVDLVEGDGGPGSIKKLNFTEAVPMKFVTTKIDVLDETNLIFIETVIAGGELISDKLEKVIHEFQIVPTDFGGCSLNSVTTYYTKEGVDMSHDEMKANKEDAFGLYMAVEAHILMEN